MKASATKHEFKTLRVDTQLDIYKANAKNNIESDKGKLIRLNRSIQAEESFALFKDGLTLKCFRVMGYKSVETEWMLFCMSASIVRFRNRLAQGKIGTPFEYLCDLDPEEIPRAI